VVRITFNIGALVMRIQLIALLVVPWNFFTVIPTHAAEPQQAGDVAIEQKSFKTKAGDVVRYEVGTLYVPENRSDAESRLIGVGFARFLAEKKAADMPPVFRLPGGPGSSFVSRLKSVDEQRFKRLLPLVAQLRKQCDVVLVDQRGFSERGDVLTATINLPARKPDQSIALEDQVTAYEHFARQTVETYAEGDVDLRGYTVKECAQDVSDLAHALGYDKISLCGTSFGSQWSFAVMRQHPDIVARALLSGVEPLDHGYDMPSHVFAAVHRMWQVVDQDERFKPYLPAGGMAEAAREVIQRLEKEPWQLEVKDPETGEKQLAGILVPKDFPWRDPTQILELYHGHTERWQTRSTGRSQRPRQINLVWPLIDTSLGVTPQRRYLLLTDPATRYLGQSFAPFLAMAEIWPSPDVGDDFRTPVFSEIPVVFANGNWDTQTPIENTFEIAPFFVNSRVLIADRGGHGVLDNILWEQPQVWNALEEFLRNGNTTEIPVRITLKPSRRFAPPRFPPPSN
jgi:pimeloyl-ACP methyl ester carboxylesterase